jgi:hypothetical protein
MVANRNHDTDYLTPGEIARERRVSINKVLAWIAAGELAAINMATRVDGERPRWRISRAALAAFDVKRTTIAPPLATPRRRQQREAIPQYV